MKKRKTFLTGEEILLFRKMLRIMKLTMFLVLVTALMVSASVYSQNTRLTLKFESIPFGELFREIEKQTEFRFAFSNSKLDPNQKIKLDATNKTLNNILNNVLPDGISFEIIDRYVIIQNANEVSSTIAKQLQQRAVAGKVTDTGGLPLPGVTVIIKGTTQGTVTDNDGEYTISNIPEDAILVFSFVGMRTYEVTVGTQVTINVTLEQDFIGIEEVVAVGYGTQKKINLTGALSTVDFENNIQGSRAISNVSNSLAGKVSGISSIQSSGLPNSNSNIRVRGIGSLNSSQEPLVIVDGVIGDLNTLNPNDISSINILKDAASAAIYGSRASNGVILVTTKAGTEKDVKLNYSGYFGIARAKRTHDLITNSADHMEVVNLAQQNSGFEPLYSEEFIKEWRENSVSDPIGYPNTDWWDVLLKDNFKMNHHISARGGNEKINFYSSVNYNSNDGLIPNTGFNRVSFRNNINFQVNDWIKIGNISTISKTDAENRQEGSIFDWWHASSPATLPKHPDGRYGGSHLTVESGANNNLRNIEARYHRENKENAFSTKFIATLTPFKNFEIVGDYFTEVFNNEYSSVSPHMSEYPLWNFKTEQIVSMFNFASNIVNQFDKSQRSIVDLFGTYEVNVQSHNFKVLAGYNQEYFKSNFFSARKEDILSLSTPVLNAAFKNPTANGNAGEYALRSVFGRLNYNYKEKYLFEANLRHDGSSRFSSKNRWGTFPSFSFAWRLSEENFWNIDENISDYLKLRVSWGKLGNSGIGNYEWQSLYTPVNYSYNGSPILALRNNAIANSNLTWETTNVFNFGLDFNLFRKLYFDVNYYNKKTEDILTLIPIPLTAGGLTPPRVNSATVNNSGVEAELTYTNKLGEFNYAFSANFSYNKNEIVEYKGDYIEPHGIGAWTEGFPIGIYWIREVDRIIQDQNEIDELVNDGWTFHPSTPEPGDFLYRNLNDDKKIDNEDRALKGNPIPLFNFGADFSANYKGIDFYLLMAGVAGWDKYLKGGLYSTNRNTIGYLTPKKYLNSWTPQNTKTSVPKLYTNSEKNNMESDYFLHDASFMKIKTIQIGYTFDLLKANLFKVDNIRIYGNLEDFFTFTSYPGQDPENNDISYPLSKTASIGININF